MIFGSAAEVIEKEVGQLLIVLPAVPIPESAAQRPIIRPELVVDDDGVGVCVIVEDEGLQLRIQRAGAKPYSLRRVAITRGIDQLIESVLALAGRIVAIKLVVGLDHVAAGVFHIVIDVNEFMR